MSGLPSEIRVNTVFKHEALERCAHIRLIFCGLRAVHGTMAHGNNPGGLGTVNSSEIRSQPLVLLVGLRVLPVCGVHRTEWSTVGGIGLDFCGVGLIAFQVSEERPLRAVGEVGLTVDRDEVSQTVVEGVPEVADATGFVTRHLEAVDVGSEVSGWVSSCIA